MMWRVDVTCAIHSCPGCAAEKSRDVQFMMIPRSRSIATHLLWRCSSSMTQSMATRIRATTFTARNEPPLKSITDGSLDICTHGYNRYFGPSWPVCALGQYVFAVFSAPGRETIDSILSTLLSTASLVLLLFAPGTLSGCCWWYKWKNKVKETALPSPRAKQPQSMVYCSCSWLASSVCVCVCPFVSLFS